MIPYWVVLSIIMIVFECTFHNWFIHFILSGVIEKISKWYFLVEGKWILIFKFVIVFGFICFAYSGQEIAKVSFYFVLHFITQRPIKFDSNNCVFNRFIDILVAHFRWNRSTSSIPGHLKVSNEYFRSNTSHTLTDFTVCFRMSVEFLVRKSF